MALDDTVPSNAIDVLQKNAEDIDSIVNGEVEVTTRTGRVLQPFPLTTAAAEYAAAGALVSQNAAAASASASSDSETASEASASAALTSENNASTSESNASTSETNAAASELAASNSASAASTSEINAASSESAASASETTASNAASSATASELVATTKASESSASEIAAANSAALSEDAKILAQAAGNYIGEWSSLTGSVASGVSVAHLGEYWGSLVAIADVTLAEPGTSSDWQSITELSGTAAQRDTGTDFDQVPLNTNIVYPVATVADLRLLEPTVDKQRFNVTSYYDGWAATVRGPTGGGEFVYDASDTTSVDDGIEVFVTSSGARIKRIIKDYVSPEMAGAYGDGIISDSSAWQSAVDVYPIVKPQSDSYLLDSTVTINHWNKVECLGQDRCNIVGPSSNFAFDIFVTTGIKTAEMSGFTLTSKNGIRERYEPTTDFENDANPTRTVYLHDINLQGTYDVLLDLNAGSAVIPTFTELTGYGIGLLSVMNYGAKRERVEFREFGIGLAAIGDTLSKTEQCRFYGNARNIHDEHVDWYNSAFGMGADNEYKHNDILDGRRWGGVYLLKSYGAVFEHNYIEHLDRNGSSSEMLLALSSTARTKVKDNHFNAFLSVENSRPFIHYSSSRSENSISADNEISENYLTPFTDVRSATVDITSGFNYTTPTSLIYKDNALFPDVFESGVQADSSNKSMFSSSNVSDEIVGGSAAVNEALWVSNSADGFYIDPTADNLIVPLTINNPSLDDIIALEFDVDDNGTGNGRVFLTVEDSDEATNIWSANAFAGITEASKVSIAFPSSIIESKKRIQLTFSSMINCKLYSVRAYIPDSLRGYKAVFDPVSLADGASEETTLTVYGARLGDTSRASFGLDAQGVSIESRVSADDTVTVTFRNSTGVTVNLASSFISCIVDRNLR